MPRNVVLCADGTCNAFGRRPSNVARLLGFLDLDRPDAQVAAYDQGIGTRLGQHREVRAFRSRLRHPEALRVLPPPPDAWSRPWTWRRLVRSMAFGDGLDENVRQLYATLSELYEPGDDVYLFGFSRGAFTVRALAGFAWRYGLAPDASRADAVFSEAWPLFRDEFPDPDGAKARLAARFVERTGTRAVGFRFLGLWDTVKSYGGLEPVMLPHLRHNPAVCSVRHALALDERRGWFEATTWGWLDEDRKAHAAGGRLDTAVLDAIRAQDVLEVWFTGCHADVGGGANNQATADIALRWMLGEARAAGLALNEEGAAFVAAPRAGESPGIHASRSLFWRAIERFERRAIDNGGKWPVTFVAPRGASPRDPLAHPRDGTVWFHETAAVPARSPAGVTVERAATRRTIDAGPG